MTPGAARFYSRKFKRIIFFVAFVATLACFVIMADGRSYPEIVEIVRSYASGLINFIPFRTL